MNANRTDRTARRCWTRRMGLPSRPVRSSDATIDGTRVPSYGSLEHRRRGGFTLVELTIVVLLMGVMAAVATPAFSGALAQNRVNAVAERLAADLNLARRHAMSASVNQEVQFLTGPFRYTMPGLEDIDHSSQDYEVVVSENAGGITAFTASFDGTTNVSYGVYGQPLAGSPLVPLVSGSVVVASGSVQKTVVVDTVTGEARVQ